MYLSEHSFTGLGRRTGAHHQDQDLEAVNRRTYNTMAKKHCTENLRLTNMNPTKKPGMNSLKGEFWDHIVQFNFIKICFCYGHRYLGVGPV